MSTDSIGVLINKSGLKSIINAFLYGVIYS